MRQFFDKFNQAFGFTKTERRVVLFLVGTFLAGLGIKAYRSGSQASHFEYSASDSEFAARSHVRDDSLIDSSKSTQPLRSSIGLSQENSYSPPLRLMNINTATKDELMTLPGIGEAMAERIILYREENGPFRKVDDLVKVKGIGSKKIERLAPLCTVER